MKASAHYPASNPLAGIGLKVASVTLFMGMLTFIKAGAGAPQMVALITAWAILGVHRVLTWELPVMGPRFAVIRRWSR